MASHLPGVYAAGWFKRGPQPPNPGREQIDTLLAERKPDLVTVEGWRAIDGRELERGRSERRPRVKLASRDELLAATAARSSAAARR
jgi:ferredoxin--NADP+ reductase